MERSHKGVQMLWKLVSIYSNLTSEIYGLVSLVSQDCHMPHFKERK